ncbi:hypothetical protein AB0O47_39950 [Streptomyces noursei]|uniref:hypothetical protein n=1 Tax=Streptomyces noursei TaxID=1971 RepID=UPI003450A155
MMRARTTLFKDPEDFAALYPDITAVLEKAAELLVLAHVEPRQADRFLGGAEQFTLRANASVAQVLGQGVDPAKLAPFMRWLVDSLAHEELARRPRPAVAGGGANAPSVQVEGEEPDGV